MSPTFLRSSGVIHSVMSHNPCTLFRKCLIYESYFCGTEHDLSLFQAVCQNEYLKIFTFRNAPFFPDQMNEVGKSLPTVKGNKSETLHFPTFYLISRLLVYKT